MSLGPYRWVALVTVLVGILDCHLTLHLVSLGAEEANPIMDLALQRGSGTFLLVKSVLHLACGGMLAVVPRRSGLADCLLSAAFAMYAYGFVQHMTGLRLLVGP